MSDKNAYVRDYLRFYEEALEEIKSIQQKRQLDHEKQMQEFGFNGEEKSNFVR